MYQGKNFMQANKRERKIKYMKEWKGHQTSKKGILGFKKPQKQLDTAAQMFFQLFKLNIIITFWKKGCVGTSYAWSVQIKTQRDQWRETD